MSNIPSYWLEVRNFGWGWDYQLYENGRPTRSTWSSLQTHRSKRAATRAGRKEIRRRVKQIESRTDWVVV